MSEISLETAERNIRSRLQRSRHIQRTLVGLGIVAGVVAGAHDSGSSELWDRVDKAAVGSILGTGVLAMVERRTALDICQNQVTTYRRNRPTVPVTDATSPRKVNLAKQAEQTAATADAPGAGQLSSIPSGAAAMLASTSAFLESNAALSHGIRLPEGDILQGIAFGIMAAAMQVVADNSLGADRFVAQLDA